MVETAVSELQHVQFVGLGPAGSGVFVAADRLGNLPELLDLGVAVINEGSPGAGSLGEVQIRSNSPCGDFVEFLRQDGQLADVLSSPAAQNLLEGFAPSESAPLPVVGAYLHALGHMTTNIIEAHPAGAVLPGRVSHLDLDRDVFVSYDGKGDPFAVSKNVVQATGAEELLDPRLEQYRHKVVLSRAVLTEEANAEIQALLARSPHPFIVVDGASHSGFSAALKLAEQLADSTDFHIDILARQEIKVFFNSEEAAVNSAYRYRGGDVCKKTGRVNRFSGLRGDAKQLFLDIVSGRERRIQIVPHNGSFDENRTLERADLIIQALGYKPRLIPVYRNGELLKSPASGVPRVKGLYTIGHGFSAPADKYLGGGKNEKRPVDGVNIYQGPAGEKIVRALLSQK